MELLNKLKLDKLNLAMILVLLAYSFFIQLRSFINIPVYVYSDSANYATLASRFAKGDFFGAVHVWWLPLYPLMGGIFYQFTHNIERALLFVSVFSGVLLIVPVFLMIYEVTKDRLLSSIGAILAAFNPVSIRHYTSLLNENLYTLSLILSCCLAVLALKRNNKYLALGAGACFGLAFMTRNEAVVYLIIYWLFCLLSLFLIFFNRILPSKITLFSLYKLPFTVVKNFIFIILKLNWRPTGLIIVSIRLVRKNIFIQTLLLSLVGFLLAVSPYYLMMSKGFGYLNLTARSKAADNGYTPMYLAFNNQTTYSQDVWSVDTLNYDSPFLKTSLKKVRLELLIDDMINGSIKRSQKYIGIFREEFTDKALFLGVFGFIYSFIVFLFKDRKSILLNLFPLLGALMILPFLPGAERRYSLWIYPFFYIFIFVGIHGLKSLLRNKFAGGAVLVITFYFFIIVFKNYLTALPLAYASSGAVNDYVEIGKFIKDQGKPNPRIMSRREAISYYAQGETIFAPGQYFDKNEFRDYLRLWKVDYIVANMENIGDSKGLAFLMAENQPLPQWLKVLKVYGEGKWRIIIYQVLIN